MKRILKRCKLSLLYSITLYGMAQAAHNDPIKTIDLSNEIGALTESIQARITIRRNPRDEEVRTYLNSLVTQKPDMPDAPAPEETLTNLQQIDKRLSMEDLILDGISGRSYQETNEYLLTVMLINARKQAIQDFKKLDSIALCKKPNIASFDQLMAIKPSKNPEVRKYLQTLAENLAKQHKIMTTFNTIADSLSVIESCDEQMAILSPGYTESVAWLTRPTHTDPNIIALQLKHKSDWIILCQQGNAACLSDELIESLLETDIPQLTSIANLGQARAARNKNLATVHALTFNIQNNIDRNKPAFAITQTPGLNALEQPAYFACSALNLLKNYTLVQNKSAHFSATTPFEELKRSCLNLHLIEESLKKLSHEYRAHIDSLAALQARLQSELDKLPQTSMIGDHIAQYNRTSRQTASRPGKKRKPIERLARKPTSTPAEQPASATCSSEDIPKPIQISPTACSSSNDTSTIIAEEAPKTKRAQGPMQETSSMIRIQDANPGITIALFKLEKPTAKSIEIYIKTNAMDLWLNNPDEALATLGYLDPSHKNFTPSQEHRIRMKNYHAFPKLADKYVTQCGIAKDYRKQDGTVHTMVCMPGAMYFANGSYQLGIFTYLIDPVKKQLYHRMFHECSGEKIVNEYHARGYWDIDPELGQA